MQKNGETRHNAAKRINHSYLLNHGLLWCGKCGSQMQGVCGTGQKGRKYYYVVTGIKVDIDAGLKLDTSVGMGRMSRG